LRLKPEPTPLQGRLLDLPANINLGREGLPETLAWYEHKRITIRKKFYDIWPRCVDTIKMSSQHSQLANDLEINKAVMYLKQKDFASAVDTLKTFEKQV
jgi:hypothetical protein